MPDHDTHHPLAGLRTTHPRFDLIICDIDGCLSPESSSPMDLASLVRIRAHNEAALARRDRPILTLCSGRPQPFAEAIAKMLAVPVPLVCENGAYLFDLASNTYALDPSITPGHIRAVHEAESWVRGTFGKTGATIQPGKSASVTVYHPDTGYLRSIMPELRAHYEQRGWPFRVSMTVLYINCDLEHISKSTGIERLLARIDVPRDRIAGVGDTMSDTTIREHADFFACPNNADPGLKRRADYIARGDEAEGVVEILEVINASD